MNARHDDQHISATGRLQGMGHRSADSLLSAGHRRWFLKVGLGGAFGLTLPQMLQLRAQAESTGAPSRKTSVILIWLSGGPSQIDTWDPKPEAPIEIRSPFGHIPTSVPGIDLIEHFPKQAAMMDKFAVIRSMDATASNHTPITFQAGNPKAKRTDNGKDGDGIPSMGSLAAKFVGSRREGLPPFVALADSMVSDVYGAGHLGNLYQPVDGMKVQGKFGMPEGVALPRLQDRDSLRREFDRMKRQADTSLGLSQQDRYVREAYDMVLSGAAHQAFDLSRESDATREKYGRNSLGEKTLLARRLVESGVTFVTLSDAWGHWDHHGDSVRWGGIEKGLKPMLPKIDHGVTTLVQDLADRGLLDTTLVIVMGEFGRSPRINTDLGRDHWGPVMSMIMAGGGIKTGQAIGATDRTGGYIKDYPLGPGDLAATVFKVLGMNPYDHWTTPQGRPTPLVEGSAAPIRALV
ncbi:MAG: DUF1501 domain-containing protein [Planctomycetaceae bacterium]|nr:DUF1501 domain-containing protein [Planctomycetaceae bacterium]